MSYREQPITPSNWPEGFEPPDPAGGITAIVWLAIATVLVYGIIIVWVIT